MNINLIDTESIAQMLGVSRAYARDRVVKSATFPRPALALSQKIKRWSKQDVENWVEKQMQRNAR